MDLPRRMDRRRFVRLLAAGAAAAAAAPLAGTAAAKPPRGTADRGKAGPAHRPPTAAMRKEIEVQKKSVADMLKVVRAYELPAGSPPAPIFRALRAARRDR